MATTLPPVPSGGVSPSGPTDFSSLLSAQPQPGPNPEAQRVVSYMTSIRQIHTQLETLAASFPEASEELDKAKTFLTNSMSRVAASQVSPAQTQPQPATV